MPRGALHSRATPGRASRGFRYSALWAALVLGIFSVTLGHITASPSQAVLIDSGDGSGNVTPQLDDPGFARMAILNNQSAVYLENGWLLTANHVGMNVNIELNGTTYSTVPNSFVRIDENDPEPPDLALVKLKGDPGFLPIPLATTTPSVGADLVMIGHGRSRGTATSWSGLDGWNWVYPYTMRWGTNQLTLQSVSGLDFSAFSIDFDAPGTSAYTLHEAAASPGDSGGGVFHKNGGTWQLAGILFAILPEENQPASTSLYTNRTLAVDVATYRNEILSIIQAPDCSNGLDDDLDGQIDAAADPGCESGADTSEQSVLLVCDNGIDDDQDGFTDYPNDPECFSSLTPAEELAVVPSLSGLAISITVLGLAGFGLRSMGQSSNRTR